MKIHFNEIKDSILSIKVDKRNDVFNWGLDNQFPSLIETLINMSVTSSICVSKVAKATYGKGFGAIGKKIVNKDGQTLNEVLRIASREYSKHNNLYIHVSYNLLFEITSIKVIPNTQSRVGKSDDLGYSGKIITADWELKPKTEELKVYNKFNPIQKVIEAQIEASKGITGYKGQIIHIQKDSNSIYSLSDLNPVLGECITEADAQEFRKHGIGNGFLQNKLITIQPFGNEDDRRAFVNSIKDMRGAKGTKRPMILEASTMTDNLSNQIKVDDFTSDSDDTIFEYSEAQARKNIALAFGVPLGLIDVSESSLFGNSGELIKQMKIQLWEDKEEERDQLEELFQKLMDNFHQPIEGELKIISPFESEPDSTQIITE